jgi:hypothetical protein
MKLKLPKLEELGPTNGWGFELSQQIPDESDGLETS